MTLTATYMSPLGQMIMASDDSTTLSGLWFFGQKHIPDRIADAIRRNNCHAHTPSPDDPEIFKKTTAYLDAYFSNGQQPEMPPLTTTGTTFQKAVWDELLHIPSGQTRSYKEIARNISEKFNRTTSPRAVAGAIARNPIIILIPCHRVISSSGQLCGFSAGIDRKRRLLAIEEKTKPRNHINQDYSDRTASARRDSNIDIADMDQMKS